VSARKTGGLNFNPLLSRTEPAVPSETGQTTEPTSTQVDTPTSTQVDTSVGAIKFTFYFTPKQLDRLDQAWAVFRRQTRGTGRRMSKSQFVRLALDRLLDDFDRDPEEVINLLVQQPQR
jgi:hypothetical protein